MQAALKAADKNGDGKLSRDEFPQPAIFKDIDKDNDGFATREEIQAYYSGRRGQGAPKQ
jgi:Ca2+-binding EF-hand superfamily protein